MKKVLNILLILLVCFVIDVYAEMDNTDNFSCVQGRTYYNIYFFRAGEYSFDAHENLSEPYDFFQFDEHIYRVGCSGTIGFNTTHHLTFIGGNYGRNQTVENASTCSGSISGLDLKNNWSVDEYWNQLKKITDLYSNKKSENGWTPNENNYIYKVIGSGDNTSEIRLIIPGSNAGVNSHSDEDITNAWDFTASRAITGTIYPVNEKSTLLPKTKVDLYFEKPTYSGGYSGKSLSKNYTSSDFSIPFYGNGNAKKFLVERKKASTEAYYSSFLPTVPPGTEISVCNQITSPFADCTYFYYSPVIYVMAYTCEGPTIEPCDENKTCCYADGASFSGATSNSNTGGFLSGIFSRIMDMLSGGSQTNVDENGNVVVHYDSTIRKDTPDHYTYTKTGYWDGKEHGSDTSGGILTKCEITCNPLEECCYKKTNQGLFGAYNALEDASNKLNDIIGRSQIISLFDSLNIIGNIHDKVNEIADSSISNILGNVNAASLRYEYVKDKPTLFAETVYLSGDEEGHRNTIQIQVPNVLDRYRAVIPYTDSNGRTNYQNIDLLKADKLPVADQNKVIMKSCGCDPEIECCYDSTGLNYNGTANMLKESKKIVDGNLVPLDYKEIEQIETYKLLESVKTAGLFGDMTTDLLQNGVDTFFTLISSKSVSEGVDKVLGLDGIETLLLSGAKAVPESQARQMKGTATQFSIKDTWGWPPVISAMTKHIYAADLSAILQVKTCGCNEETECCYDANGNYHYEYAGYNGFRWGATDSKIHYQRIELSDNPYYNRDTFAHSGITGALSAELTTFMQTTTTPVVKCKAYHIDMDYACTVDDYQEVSSGKYIEASPNRIEKDSSGNVIRDYDSWYSQLSRGKATGVGYSILPDSMKSLRYRGMDIVCADAYKITYPGIQDSGQKGQFVTIGNNNSYFTYNREFNNKTIDTRAPIAKIELKKTCVSTKALSTRTFNPTDILVNQVNFNVQHQFFKNYLQYSNLFGIDLDHNQTTDPTERAQIANSITEYIKGNNSSNTPIVKARLYYDDYDTAIKDNQGYIDLDLRAIKCPNLHKQFIEVQADENGELRLADLGIFCADESGNELTSADDSRSSPVYACSDTTAADLQNETGDSFYERMWAKCAAIPAAEDYADQNVITSLGVNLEKFWYDFLNGFWTVKDYYYKSENIVLYASIPQIIVKGGTAITYMDKFDDSVLAKNSEYVVLPNNSIPIGFDTTSGTKNFRISVDINMGPTRKMPTLDTEKPSKVPQSTWDEWSKASSQVGGIDSEMVSEVSHDNTIEDYSLQNYIKNQGLTDKANISSPHEAKTLTSDGYIGSGGTEQYICSYKVDEDLGNANFFYRTIALSDINPQKRALGANWNYSNLASTKGPYNGLVQRIEAYKASRLAGTGDDSEDNLFKQADNDYQVLTGKDKFTFRLSTPTMRLIRRYNRVKMSIITDNSGTLNNNSAVGGNQRRGYADWSLGIVDYNGLSEEDSDGNVRRFDNADGSTKWIVDFKDTSSSASTTVPDYVYRRYNNQDNNIGYHWYSPFLWCIYYGGNDYCNDIVSPVQTIKYTPEVKQDIKDVFSSYKSDSNQSEEWDLKANIQKLITKQNKLDYEAYKNVTNGEKLIKSEDPTRIYVSMDHVPTLEEFGSLIWTYASTFRDVLSGADQGMFTSEASTVLKRLLSSVGIELNQNGNNLTDDVVSGVVSQMVRDVLGKLSVYE